MVARAAGQVEIRPVTDIPGLHEVERLQLAVWGPSPRDIVPYHQLLAASGAGGVVLGAFDAEGTLIGFCYGFVGLREGSGPFLYSHMAAVLEAWRGRGLGFRLKQAQREAAQARGLDRIVWTYDPLQAANAAFNLRKLGAVARRYYVNYYGEMTDTLNRGLGSDRLEVDWHLSTRPHGEDLSTAAATAPWGLKPDRLEPLPTPGYPVTGHDAPAVRIAIPRDIATLRDTDVTLATRWREASRHALVTYLGRGYAAVDFVAGEPAGFYVLQRDPGLAVLTPGSRDA